MTHWKKVGLLHLWRAVKLHESELRPQKLRQIPLIWFLVCQRLSHVWLNKPPPDSVISILLFPPASNTTNKRPPALCRHVCRQTRRLITSSISTSESSSGSNQINEAQHSIRSWLMEWRRRQHFPLFEREKNNSTLDLSPTFQVCLDHR